MKNAKGDEAGPADNDWLEVGKKNRSATMRAVCYMASPRFIALMLSLDQEHRVSYNADIWWQVPVNIEGASSTRLDDC